MSFYPTCYAESLTLYYSLQKLEWTGPFPVPQSQGGWGATGNINTDVVAFHHDQVGNAWAHEGAHQEWEWDQDHEWDAIERANECVVIYGAP
jgi:hypothetical protein